MRSPPRSARSSPTSPAPSAPAGPRSRPRGTRSGPRARRGRATKLDETTTKVSTFLTNLPGNISTWWAEVEAKWNEKWTWARETVGTRITETKGKIQTFFTNLPGNISTWFASVSATWGAKFAGLRDTAKRLMDEANTKIKTVLATIKGSFDTGVTNIGKAWDKLKEKTKTPVKFVVDTVYNTGIRGVWNKVAGIIGAKQLDEVRFARGGITPGYTPGKDVHSFFSPTAGRMDLSGGEAVMRPEWTKAVGAKAIGAWNSIAASEGVQGVKRSLASLAEDRGQRFYSGGLVTFGKRLQKMGYHVGQHPAFGPVGRHSPTSAHYTGDAIDVNADGRGQGYENMMLDRLVPMVRAAGFGMKWRVKDHYDHAHVDTRKDWWVNGVISYLKKAVGGAAGNVKEFFLGNLAEFAGKTFNPLLNKITGGVGDTPFGQMIGGLGKKGINGILSLLTRKDREASVGDIGGAARWAPTVRSVLAELGQTESMTQWVLKLIERESGGNPNAVNNWDSNARAGHPSQGLMQTIPSTFNEYAGKYRGLGIRNPRANIYAGLNYGIHRYGSIGNIPGIKSMMFGNGYKPYDTGGILEHGDRGINLSGKPEVVFTDPQWRTLRRIVAHTVTEAEAPPAARSIGTLIEEGAVQFVLPDGSPVPEAAATQRTLNDGMRRLADFGLFD